MLPASRHQDGEHGFTLVEVLISLFIFSVISVGTLVALSTTLNAREKANARIVELESLAAARRLLADDFAAMTRRQNRDGLGGFIDAARTDYDTGRFELTRRARLNPDGAFPRGDLLRVSWRVENGQLIRSFLPHENPAYIEPPIDRIILDGVDGLAVRPIFNDTLLNDIRLPNVEAMRADALSLLITHSDGTTTEHIFELPGA